MTKELIRLIPLLATLPAAAHELDASVQFAAPAIVIRASYAGADPVPFAKVQVFKPSGSAGGPSGSTGEFQAGLTDRRGYFSFVPDSPGDWRVVVDDEEGHRREVPVKVPSPFTADAASGTAGTTSRLERAITGLAILLGATGVLYGIKARRSS